MKRLALVFLPAVVILMLPLTALAEDQPFKTVVDGIVPKTPGLTIQGSAGGCDLLLQNQTGQDVILFDLSKPPKPFRFAAQARSASPKPPIPVHLTGAWPCASLPAVTEDQRWNHAEATVIGWTFYLRIAVGALIVGGLLIAGPYLFKRRREILGNSKKAA